MNAPKLKKGDVCKINKKIYTPYDLNHLRNKTLVVNKIIGYGTKQNKRIGKTTYMYRLNTKYGNCLISVAYKQDNKWMKIVVARRFLRLVKSC